MTLTHNRGYYRGQNLGSEKPTAQEERELFLQLRAKANCAKVVEIIAARYIQFALSKARKSMGARKSADRSRVAHSEDDAISAANLGLMEAIRKFDPTRGIRFTTYADFWIQKRLREHGYAAHVVRVPKGDRELFSTLIKLRRKGMTDLDIAELMGIEKFEVSRVLSMRESRQQHIETHFNEGEEEKLLPTAPEVDSFVSPDRGEQREVSEKLEQLMLRLGSSERTLLHYRFKLGLPLSAIAKMRKCSVSKVQDDLAIVLRIFRLHLTS